LTYGIVRSPDVNAEMTYSRGRTVIVGGFEIVPDPARPESFNRIADGGDSGAAWMACDSQGRPTDRMLGLHFAVGGDAARQFI
jgi:endonuclease G